MLGGSSVLSDDPLLDIEFLIEANDLPAGRTAIRAWLFGLLVDNDREGSIGDALFRLSSERPPPDHLPQLLLRWLAVDGLLPEPNAKNQLERHITGICEAGAADLCAFVGVKPKSQTYEKFELLKTTHGTVTRILNPLAAPYGDLPALVRARKVILGCLNHVILRTYASPFHFSDYKSATEVLFSTLEKVESLGPSFLHDLEACQHAIESFDSVLSNYPSFLARSYFAPLLTLSKDVLEQFLATVRTKYVAQLVPNWTGTRLPKRYPLHEDGREFHLVVPLRNTGAGLAIDVQVSTIVSTERVTFANPSIKLGSVQPGDFSVVLDAMLVRECADFEVMLSIDWSELGNPDRLTAELTFKVEAQNRNVDWPSVEYSSPYSTAVAKGNEFIGRTDLVRGLASKLLRSTMEPFYITGQKRVGKTSLASAVCAFAETNNLNHTLSAHYILWGDVANASPLESMRALGKSIERFVQRELGLNIVLPSGTYDGSLSELIAVSDVAAAAAPNKRFVFVIDEFDEIPRELYLQGNLAETFFANLRSISRRSNFCIVLVGGENMPFIMDRQGQKLNNFARVNLSYFSREKEWQDFQRLVRLPTDGSIHWHEDAISEVFNASNGNPYFAKIVCAGVVQGAVAERDADITVDEVRASIEASIPSLGANSFAHLWQDGIPHPTGEREPDILRRSRVLVAVARCVRQGSPLTVEKIYSSRVATSLRLEEVQAVLNDFVQRNVLRESGGVFDFVLSIFRWWLVDAGAQQLISDSLGEEIANAALQAEDAAHIKSHEVVALARTWPTYRGMQIGTDDIRAWYQQVASPLDQRVLFTLLQRTRFFSDVLVREKLREAFGSLRTSLPVPVIRSRNERRTDILVTYVDGDGKSGSAYAALYAEENRISSSHIVHPANFHERVTKSAQDGEVIAAIVIVDDLVATGDSLSENVAKFIEDNRTDIGGAKVHVVAVASTQQGNDALVRRISKIDYADVEFKSCIILKSDDFAFPEDRSGFRSEDEWERAQSLCKDIGSKIDRKRPMGYGGMGLLVVFPTNVPNNTLPLIRSYSRSGAGAVWRPLFERISR